MKIVYIIGCLFSLTNCSSDQPITNNENNNKTVVIGKQIWTTKNLDVQTYSNGDTIPNIEDNLEWISLKTGAWCYYLNDDETGKSFGKLYNWYAINDPRGIVPVGFKIPSEADFNVLNDLLCHQTKNCSGTLKSTSSFWNQPNIGATNKSNFNALPAGFRAADGNFNDINQAAYFWSASEINERSAFRLSLHHSNEWIDQDFSNKTAGFSVRLLKQ